MSYDMPPPPPPYGQPSYGGVPGGDGGALRGATLPQAYQRFWKKYAEFNGRASRSEFWWTVLANFVIGLILGAIVRAIHAFQFVEYLWDLATLIPSIALGVRRLHDVAKSGWWLLLWLICVIGWIILIVWWAMPPKPEASRYNAV